MNKILVICGPTATGKTVLAVKLAKQFNGELVSADSRQVYTGMDIGTGKDRAHIDVPIWMYDVVKPNEEFSVSHYVSQASAAIENIRKRNKLPIIVGGTGLYIHALLHPIETINIPPNTKLRDTLKNVSVAQLLEKVSEDTLLAMNESDRQNPRRLIRKIEIASAEKPKQTDNVEQDTLIIGLTDSLEHLYKRIDRRVDARVEEGIVEEIGELLKQGYSWDLPSMSGLGYSEWRDYFEKSAFKDEVITRWKFDEHGYARRQQTWFKKQKDIHWFDITSQTLANDIVALVSEWYT